MYSILKQSSNPKIGKGPPTGLRRLWIGPKGFEKALVRIRKRNPVLTSLPNDFDFLSGVSRRPSAAFKLLNPFQDRDLFSKLDRNGALRWNVSWRAVLGYILISNTSSSPRVFVAPFL